MTEYKRYALLDGVYLTAVRTDACAQSCLSMTFLTQLSRETAALNAVLPHVLLRGSSRLPDTEAVQAAMRSMDGDLTPVVKKLGELQVIGLRALFRADAFSQMAQELTALLLAPNTRGGLLRPDWVKAEAAALPARQAAQPRDARTRLIEEMCCYEDFALSAFGDAEGAESIHYQKLTRRYHALVAESPLEIFYCGTTAPRDAAQTLAELLSGMMRGELDEALGTDVRMNSLEPEARTVTEAVAGLQEAELAVGWRLGEQMEDPDPAALRLMAGTFEQALKAALAPESAVELDLHKGLLLLTCPLRTSAEAALGVIRAQAELISAGALPEEIIRAALEALEAQLRTIERDADLLADYWTERAPLGLLYSPEELIGLLHEVTHSELSAAAKALECDMVYVRTIAPEDDAEAQEE